MGDPRGFLTIERKKERERAVDQRVRDFHELAIAHSEGDLRAQASRCMDCGIPFCHQGCPLGNLIPEWNDLVHEGRHEEAIARLHATNNFPEFTGRVCPAPCEASCVLNLNEAPVTIKEIERAIVDRAIRDKQIVPVIARTRVHGRVAVIGSGPAGLAAAQELARSGHAVTVFEKDDRPGGLLRYGIPDFKMEKGIIDRRIAQMEAEGVRFVTGVSPSERDLRPSFDAIVLAIGARAPRDLPIDGRALAGIHFAMDFLVQQNRRVAGLAVDAKDAIVATGKDVVVIGGGDTGSDCVGTSVRQGARSVTQLELMPKPALVRMPTNPWPEWPLVLRTSSSHEEGAARDWSVRTRSFGAGADGTRVTRIDATRVAFEGGKMRDVEGPELAIPCDLVLLAMGFVGVEQGGILGELGVALDDRGNVRSDARGRTNVDGVFAAGDSSRGQSLVVWAIADGRRVADGVRAYLANRALKGVSEQEARSEAVRG